MKKTICVALLSLLVGACATQTQKPLAEQLAGKTGEEKKETLRLACLNEAEYSTKKRKERHPSSHRSQYHMGYTSETSRLKTLCREMADNFELDESTHVQE